MKFEYPIQGRLPPPLTEPALGFQIQRGEGGTTGGHIGVGRRNEVSNVGGVGRGARSKAPLAPF